MTWQSGGGGGYPGVTPDGLAPPGIRIVGGLVFGSQSASIHASNSQVYGSLTINDTLGNVVDGARILSVVQHTQLPVDGFGENAFSVNRSGDITDADYEAPAILLQDGTASGQDCLYLYKQSGNGVALKLDGKLASTDVIAHTIGDNTGTALPIYDATNTLIGYIPIYA